jgi:transposase InsO family protein
MSQQQFPDDAGASLSPAAQPCGAAEPAPVAALPPAYPPAEGPAQPPDKPAQPPDKPAQPPDKPAQPAGEPGHQPHAPVELTDQELELLDQPIELPINPTPFGASPARLAGRGPTPARRLVSPQEAAASNRKLTPEQKLLILDTWQRSGLPVTDFAALVGINRVTLYGWKKRFEELGPAGLDDQPRKKPAGKVPDLTKRTILMLKKANPQWGCQRISDVLYRGPGLPASANTVAAILREAGYVLEEQPTTPHPDKVRSFERAKPNQLWQTDLFTFVLKRQNRRVYLVAFMDDHSRFIVGYALHASCTAPLVIEAFKAAVVSVGAPEEVLTDNGPQYITWRGTSKFAAELQRRGIKHIVATPRRPQTLGKVERFWGTLWRECLGSAVFLDLADAQKRVGHFIDYYNFQRPHQGIEGLAPADRFFGAAPQILATLKARVQGNALELARSGSPKAPFYIAGQVNGKPFSVHSEGERLFMLGADGQRSEIDLATAQQIAGPSAVEQTPKADLPDPVTAHGLVNADLQHEAEPPPGTSPLDEPLQQLHQSLADGADSSAPEVSPIPEGGDL